MSARHFSNGRILASGAVLECARIEEEDGRILSVSTARQAGDEEIDLRGGWLAPGFVDVQVNGGGGILFNDAMTVDAIRAIGAAHARFGTTAFLPTLISDDPGRVERALDAVDTAIAAGVPGVVGVHIEGPFLNARRKGIHDERKFRLLDADAIALLTRPRRGAVMLTLAPELCPPGAIAALVAGGVRVSAGHTDADYDTTMAALAAGVTGFTHLFNAMSPLHHREPGVVGAALDHGSAWCGLIADGAHIHPAVLRIATKALPADRIMLVTDAMPSVGTDATSFVLQGKPIRVDGGVCLDAAGTLAGSHLDMARAVRTMIELAGASPAAACAMASANPAAFLGLSAEIGALAPGRRADWVLLDRHFGARETWSGGQRIAPA